MLYEVAEQIASMFDGILIVGFLAYILGVRKNKEPYIIIFVFLQYMCAQYLMAVPILQIAVGLIINIVLCKTCLKESWIIWCLWSIIVFGLYTIASSITFPVISLITGDPMSNFIGVGGFVRLCVLLINKLVQVIFLWLILLWKKSRLYLKWQEWLLILLILVAVVFILSSLLMINLKLGISGVAQIHILAIFALLFLILGCCAFLILNISAMNQKENKGKIVKLQWDTQKEMIEKARDMQRDMQIMYHDLKHYTSLWLTELRSEKYEELEKHMLVFAGTINREKTQIYYVVENELINTVMYEKAEICEQKRILTRWQITAKYPEDREMDMAIILSNLMDNAIRAEEAYPEDKRIISVEFFMLHDIRHMVVSNYIAESVLNKNPSLRTTKKDHGSHGIGLLSVKQIVEKYDGLMDILEEDNQFLVHIVNI